MILADTNVIIDFWNSPTTKAKKIFSENDIAIKYDCEIWTNDKHFKLMKTVLPTLRLYLE